MNRPETNLQTEINLYLAKLESTALPSRLQALLAADELQRAQLFVKEDARNRFLHSRALLRIQLAALTGIAADKLMFTKTAEGKPFLLNSSLVFNISHSGDYFVLGVGLGIALGVDVERETHKRAIMAIAERYFAEGEFMYLKTLSEVEQLHEFYRLWTLKEAFFKARGTGIVTGLENACFSLQGEKIDLLIDPRLNEERNLWRAQTWKLSDNYSLAVCACVESSSVNLPIKLMCLGSNTLVSAELATPNGVLSVRAVT